MLIKLGEMVCIAREDIQTSSSIEDDNYFNILEEFRKTAKELKKIAPKAKDFLYFSAIMMHSAEAALLDDSGKIKKDASGNEIVASWENNGDSWKWKCSDLTLLPMKNANGDIFPESELIKAHKKWIGKPLCLDHKSSSVDMIRGVIVDTYYDRPNRRIVALCALDKKNYPDLARKVETGYAASVSMGVAVGRAICSDCGKVAKVENDFCDHMRRKSCYGEINVDLNPIELSIVVNGADPKAKIRHIVAAANSIAEYSNMKNIEFKKLAQEDETKDIELASEIEKGLEEVNTTVSKLKELTQDLKNREEAEQKKYEASESVHSTSDSAKESAVKEDGVIKEANSVLEDLLNKVSMLNEKFNKLSKNSEEITMSTKSAYWLGGGGVNEPTPGKPKYNKEDEDSIRANQDKQMVGQMNTGPVEGMHPGYESFGESEEARKKRLLRASDERDERALRRQAALERAAEALKSGYWLGGGGVNEPTPGKPKYPKEDADSIRLKEDKQMVGQPPFPGVGDVEGLHPSPASADVKDELKRKEMLARAKLNGRFDRVKFADGTQDKANSSWLVYADDKLILKASVNDISKGQIEKMYDQIATKEFGKALIAKVRNEGFEKAASNLSTLLKTAQPLPAPPTGQLPMEAPKDEKPMDKGDSGNPMETVENLTHELQNLSSDLAKAVEAMEGEPGGELKDFDELAAGGAGMEPATASQVEMMRKLAQAIQEGLPQLIEEVNEVAGDLKLSHKIYNDPQMKTASTDKKEALDQIIADACVDAKVKLAEGHELMKSVVKYAHGSQVVLKRVAEEVKVMKTAQVAGLEGVGESDPQLGEELKMVQPAVQEGTERVNPVTKQPETWSAKVKGHMSGWVPDADPKMYWDDAKGSYVAMEHPIVNLPNMDISAPKPVATKPVPAGQGGTQEGPPMGGSVNLGLFSPEERGKALQKGVLKQHVPSAASGITKSHPESTTPIPLMSDRAKDDDQNDLKAMPDGSLEGNPDEVGKAMKEMKAASFDLSTKAGRAEYRAKMAEKLMFSDMIDKAHPGGGFTTKLDVKPSGDLAKVETIKEVNEKMLEIANAPPKVKKLAEEIQKFVVEGKINPDTDFDNLIVNGGLDSDAVKYWKSFFGQAKDGGSEFASELVKEHVMKKANEEKEVYKVKVARAYALTHAMAARNLVNDGEAAFNAQVNEIIDWDDKTFEKVKATVERQPLAKTASYMPQVGLLGASEVIVAPPQAVETDFTAQLKRLW